MNIIDMIRQRILKFLGIEKLNENPNAERLNFIGDNEEVNRQKLKENKIWYIGDSNELLNFYTNQTTFGNAREPIYDRNKANYFWGISTLEGDIKRVHSGIPNAIVTTLVNAIGFPKITGNPNVKSAIEKMIEENDFVYTYNQMQMPLTMAEGWGAYKINFDKNLSDVPMIQYYEAENVKFAYKDNILIGIIYEDYYKYKNKDYVLFETRRKANGNSIIEYELARLEKNNECVIVPLSTIPELAEYENRTIVIEGLNEILGVPTKFFYDAFNKNYGRSIFMGKVDLFDDLDQILSQDSQTVRVSTPVEYYPVDLLERNGKNGNPEMPKAFNRQFIKKEGIPSGDGTMDGTIQTTQPQLNFDQYSQNAKAKLDMILTGLLSPATMGIDIAKKDNADAQREKEKVTIMTRNNIINRESKILKKLFTLCLYVMEYMETGNITLQDFDFGIKFDEFANPSFENELQVLGNAWSNGEISTKKYVELLWGDKLSDEEVEAEIEWLDNNRQNDNLDFGDLDGTEGKIGTSVPNEETEERTNASVEE